MYSIGIIVVVVLLALAFDYVNGFHDTANAIATSVSTKALSPRTAILIAATLNFLGAMSGTAAPGAGSFLAATWRRRIGPS